MNTPLLISLDMDGTFLLPDKPMPDPKLLMRLQTLRDIDGVRWVINTDRPEAEIVSIAMDFPADQRPDAMLALQHLIYLRNDDDEMLPDTEWNDAQRAVHMRLWPTVAEEFPSWQAHIQDSFETRNFVCDHRVFQFIVTPGDEAPSARRVLLKLIEGYPEIQVTGNGSWIYLMPTAYSKGFVLEAYAQRLGIDPQRVLAIGDGYNDISMLNGRVAAAVGCPVNAAPEVKEVVRRAGGLVAEGACSVGTRQVIDHYFGV